MTIQQYKHHLMIDNYHKRRAREEELIVKSGLIDWEILKEKIKNDRPAIWAKVMEEIEETALANCNYSYVDFKKNLAYWRRKYKEGEI